MHIEIYLGGSSPTDKERTIGSRFQKGRVAEFPSYKFESTLYHSIQHHFRCLACRRRERGWWPVSRLP